MRPLHQIICCLVFGCLFLTACEEEPKPTSLMPELRVEKAGEVTRTTALLTGEVKPQGEGSVTTLQFRYGTSTEMEKSETCDPSQLQPAVRLSELRPNTTYYYCLEAGNGCSTVQSTPLSFTTNPNQIPVIKDFRMISQGPLSITLQYELADDGGEPVTSVGFYYQAENGEEQQYSIVPATGTSFRARISGLQPHTTYTAQAYATNSIGETRSATFGFRTGQAITVTAPGTLPEAIDDNEKYLYTAINIAGPLNGTDIRFIREMLGKEVGEKETPGRLSVLDLTDATIHSGGISYDGTKFTEENTITYGMFAHCIYLQKLMLPDNIRKIEEGAFKNCTALTSLQIPASCTQVAPSEGCQRLAAIEVSAANQTHRSIDGVLYDKEGRQLYWFPEGKENVPAFPVTLECIEAYAFRHCRIKQIELPATVKEIKKGAFYAARFESIVLPEQLTQISNGLFQECRQLTSVTLGSHISYLSEYCFDDCPLQHLFVQTKDIPPMCKETTFQEEHFKTCTLYVPADCLSIYRNSPYWGKFEKMVAR